MVERNEVLALDQPRAGHAVHPWFVRRHARTIADRPRSAPAGAPAMITTPGGSTLAEPAVVAMIGDHFEAIGQDEVRAGEAYANDAVLEYVQSGERIAGRANIVASRQAYPGRPAAFEVVRITGGGDAWVAELVLRFEGADPHPVAAILELRDGRIVRERLYIAEPWEPPAYRARWDEPIAPAG